MVSSSSEAGSDNFSRRRSTDPAEAEAPFEIAGGLPVDFGIGVDEVVERLALLRRVEHEVAAERELDAVARQRAELSVLQSLLLRLARVDRDPTALLVVELGPAMVSADLALGAVGDREADEESRRDPLRA